MTAQDNLNPQQFLYHESPLTNRESIRSGGLQASKPLTPRIGEDVYPHGVYMSNGQGSEYGSSMNDSSWFGYDKWRVDVRGLDVQRDPDPGHNTSWYSPSDVPADRVKLAKKGHPDWQQHL